MHENADFFPNSRQWNPENFSPERAEQRPKNSFVGFSLGARGCLGKFLILRLDSAHPCILGRIISSGAKYAMTSMKTQLIYLLRNFHVRTNRKYEDVVTIMDVMQRSKNGYPVILDIRENK